MKRALGVAAGRGEDADLNKAIEVERLAFLEKQLIGTLKKVVSETRGSSSRPQL